MKLQKKERRLTRIWHLYTSSHVLANEGSACCARAPSSTKPAPEMPKSRNSLRASSGMKEKLGGIQSGRTHRCFQRSRETESRQMLDVLAMLTPILIISLDSITS
jgi:hypothetical protein